jgi:FG-GAP-like repeat
VNGDGTPDVVTGLTDVRLIRAALNDGQYVPVQHMLAAWSTADGSMLPAFPRFADDWMFLTAPVLADVDGDGVPEVIAGNGLGVVHAYRADGSEPAGWPKRIGQWVLASVAAGDVDGDGHTDVVVATRLGRVFVFRTKGLPSAAPWPSMRGGRTNTAAFPG